MLLPAFVADADSLSLCSSPSPTSSLRKMLLMQLPVPGG